MGTQQQRAEPSQIVFSSLYLKFLESQAKVREELDLPGYYFVKLHLFTKYQVYSTQVYKNSC